MSGALFGIAINVVMALEQVTGMPIAIAQRTNDPFEFRDMVATTLCEKTGDNFCSQEFDFIDRTTAHEGWAIPMNYLGDDGTNKAVCLLLPPSPNFSPSHAATVLSEGEYYSYEDQPTWDELEAWFIIHWAARCLDQDGATAEERRADAFASMTLALIQGDPLFTRYNLDTPARKFAFFRHRDTTGRAVDLAERHMLNIWKPEAAESLREQNCNAQATSSNNTQVSQITRDIELPNCFTKEERRGGGGMVGIGNPVLPVETYDIVPAGQVPVTDANLHLWMYGETTNAIAIKERDHGEANPMTGAPPRPWHPFKGFSSNQQAISYIWQSASSIAGL